MRRSSSLMRLFVYAVDWLAFVLSGVISYYSRFGFDDLSMPQLYGLLIVQSATLMVIVSSYVYRNWPGGKFRAMLGRVGVGWIFTWALMMAWLVLVKSGSEYSRIWLVTWWISSLLMSWMGRLLIFGVMSWMRGSQFNHLRVLLVGESAVVSTIQRRVQVSTWTGYDLVGTVAIDDLQGLRYAVKFRNLDEIWICPPGNEMKWVQPILDDLRYSTVNIRLVPDFGAFHVMNNGLTVMLGVPMLDISSSPMSGINLVLKWLEDRILGLIILIMISPLMLLIAMAIKMTSSGPVIFKQKRNGWNGDTIEVYKFRSMYVQDSGLREVVQASKGDPRVTPIGRFLRRSSLDELPQFFNVLQGTMSIVGPRPHAVSHNLKYRNQIPRYMLRHKVKPGITGWAQVNGYRGETDTLDKMEARVQADLHYIENWSLWFDFKIIVMTLYKGFFSKNAY